MTMTEAFGTSTPTSMTEVATRIFAFPLAKRSMSKALFSAFCFPWTTAVTYSGAGNASVICR